MPNEENSREFIALLRESGIAAELLASGVTALGKANAAQHGWYNQAFFNLSIGLERAVKIVMVINHCLEHSGTFPSDKDLRTYGHDIKGLLEHADVISQQRRAGEEYATLPSTDIHKGIIETFSEFANATRYYNLDLLVLGKGKAFRDPLAAWIIRVGNPILKKHYSARRQDADKKRAEALEQVIGSRALIRHHTESGTPINSVERAALHSAETKVIQKYGQLYVLQIIRFLAYLISDLTYQAHEGRLAKIPYLNEFFTIFINGDAYFKSRRTWSIYRR
jgi:hypothetical protein